MTPTSCARTGSSSPPTSASSTNAAASRPSTSSPVSAALAGPSRRGSRSASSCCAPPRARTASLTLDGEPLTCERIKLEVERAFAEHGAAAEEFTVSHGAQTAVGHDGGSGPIAADDVVLFDLYPRDRESACYSDFTRTFALGSPSDELREYHRLAKEALDLAVAAVKPGVKGSDIHRQVCDFFHEHGHKTQLHKEEGEALVDGYFHATGHGVGLEVHERPGVGRIESEPLVEGDVIALEPGLYRHGYGGRPARGPRPRHRGRRRGADDLPVRLRALAPPLATPQVYRIITRGSGRHHFQVVL